MGDVCEACAEVVHSHGVGVIVSSSTGTSTGSYYATSDLGRISDELQTALGQGPSISAAAEGTPVLVPDLSQPQARRRWPVFAESASAQGLRSLFAFPIGTGVAMLGALTVHRSDTGPLGEEGLACGLASAEAALDLMLHRGPETTVPWANGSDLGSHQVEVHQAAGMVSVQLDVAMDEAYARLRAHAFRHDLTLADVATEVVRRRLRFSPDPATG
ncbi:GAF and ANTAR domain-containing protein [Nocardiopsis halophila]|uniref:GAF and ANTAR domain-containing protein n=1 Tax=Nocardiopsis halophila TaxID=141692 RepID=UPI000379A23C|nr:GAF and ANTAR domain-containing protein [Nocardiopsis halophila]